MKQSLSHIPQDKQAELEKIIQIIKDFVKVEMIILFGSFARGDWVEDKYLEEHVLYEYKSDFDILVVVKDNKMETSFGIWNQIESKIRRDKAINTPVSLIIDNIDFINEQLGIGRYFYSDIKKEGILLFDSGKFKLSKAYPLSSKDRKKLAKEDFNMWFLKAQHAFYICITCLRDEQNMKDHMVKESSLLYGADFLKYTKNALNENVFNWGAFHLHQATESLFVTVLLVFTGYRPKTHNLEKLYEMVLHIETKLKKIFPIETKKEKRLFQLLNKAYVDARYKKTYVITKSELMDLSDKITELKKLTNEICQKKINNL